MAKAVAHFLFRLKNTEWNTDGTDLTDEHGLFASQIPDLIFLQTLQDDNPSFCEAKKKSVFIPA
jgi:hypothetical protein